MYRQEGRDCVREVHRADLRLEVSVDVRCLRGLPGNVTCASIAEAFPRAEGWPHGFGVFDPFRGCSGFDVGLVDAICTLRCAVEADGGRHAELFCSYDFDKHGRHQLRERGLRPNGCELSAACLSATTEETMLSCYAWTLEAESASSAAALLSLLDLRAWLVAGLLLASLGVGCCAQRSVATTIEEDIGEAYCGDEVMELVPVETRDVVSED